MFFLILFAAFPVCLSMCIFESTTAPVTWSQFTRETADLGCVNSGCRRVRPMASFPEDEFDGASIATCESGNVYICGKSGLVGASIRSLLRNPMFRTFQKLGLESDEGWWTGARLDGGLLDGGYVAQNQRMLLGGISEPTGVKKWLCVCEE